MQTYCKNIRNSVHMPNLVIEHAENKSTFRLCTHSERVGIYYKHTDEHRGIIFKAKKMNVLAEQTGCFTLIHAFTKYFNQKIITVTSDKLLFAGLELMLKNYYLRYHGNLCQFDIEVLHQ